MPNTEKIVRLFREELVVVNMGLDTFADALSREGVKVLQMNWRPPAGGNQRLIALLERMEEGEKQWYPE